MFSLLKDGEKAQCKHCGKDIFYENGIWKDRWYPSHPKCPHIPNNDKTIHRCEATLGWVDNPQCDNTARIEIGGKKYCHMHASIEAEKRFGTSDKFNLSTSARCECTSQQVWSWKGDYELREAEGFRCKRNAIIQVDGINMCCQHARKIILQHFIKDQKAKVLSYNGTYRPLCYV